MMLGAGLIKLRGDSCWRDLTCLYYHFETQPIPNPLSRTLHFLPHAILRFGVLWNHFVEVVVPWFSFGPRVVRTVAGLLMASFQLMLIASGNLAFLNWLTLVPIVACFDDAFLRRVLPRRLVARADRAAAQAVPTRSGRVVVTALFGLVAVLSIQPVLNLVSPGQVMNTSFDRLHLVNTYGAFGSVGRQRYELVVEGTRDSVVTAHTRWKAYAFKCKPGDPMRRPCLITPYHLRLDWQIWFAAMTTPNRAPWMIHLVWKLLHNDPGTLSLLDGNPFPGEPPRYVRVTRYRYAFAPPGNPDGAWWVREELGPWLPPLSAGDPALRNTLHALGWDE